MTELVALVLCALGASLFSWRLRSARRAGRGDTRGPGCDVSIVVPARNEAHNLPTLLASLNALEPPAREIIVVDDQSNDGSADVARSFGARVLPSEPMPPGWIGKSWACATGARAATGRHILFTDADTWHAPDSLARSLAALHETRTGLVSLIPTHRVQAFWEQFQGVFQLLLLIATRAGARDRPASGERRFAIGQYLLFRRDVYDAIGGHGAVAQRLAEDLALARVVADAGHGVHVQFAPDALRVRMYPEGFAAFFAGWRRSFRDGVGSVGVRAVLEIVLVNGWLLGIPLWFAAALWSGRPVLAVGWVVVYGLSAWLVARAQRHYGPFHGTSALVYPAFVLVFVAVSLASLVDSLRGAPVQWRGRSISLT